MSGRLQLFEIEPIEDRMKALWKQNLENQYRDVERYGIKLFTDYRVLNYWMNYCLAPIRVLEIKPLIVNGMIIFYVRFAQLVCQQTY